MTVVYQYEENGDYKDYFNSITCAANSVGVAESSIRRALDKSNRKVKNYYWSTEQKVNLFSNTNLSRGEFSKVIKEIDEPYLPKILILDIETAPNRAYVWRLWKQNVYLDQIISNWFILTWAAKWVNNDTIYSEKLNEEEIYLEDDKRIMKKLWTMLDDADIMIAHNGNSFDIPKINSRFLINQLPPPSSYKQIDTKIIAKKQFGFESNKLDHLANQLGIEGKCDTDFTLWSKCMNGDQEAMEYMEFYNRKDVTILEKVYFKLRPYITGHPNLDMYYDDSQPHCPNCGSKSLIPEIDKKFYTQAVQYQLYRCKECNSLSRAKKGDKLMYKKQISAIPR